MENIIFGDAKEEDIPELICLLNALFTIEIDFKPNVENQHKGLKLLIDHPASGTIKVARNSLGKVIGMVSAQLVISTAQGAYSAWIEDMVVESGYRGQNIGKRLLSHSLEWAKAHGATRAQLLVDLSNESALGYYQHLSWEGTQLQARRIFL